jgi:XFP N-terminal domain
MTEAGPLPGADLDAIDARWRAGTTCRPGQIYLMGNPLLAEPLRPEHVKPRLLGHCSEPSSPLTRSATRRMARVGATWNFGGMGCVAVAEPSRKRDVSLQSVVSLGP